MQSVVRPDGVRSRGLWIPLHIQFSKICNSALQVTEATSVYSPGCCKDMHRLGKQAVSVSVLGFFEGCVSTDSETKPKSKSHKQTKYCPIWIVVGRRGLAPTHQWMSTTLLQAVPLNENRPVTPNFTSCHWVDGLQEPSLNPPTLPYSMGSWGCSQ
jgi:hypothetical protein